MNLSTLWKAVLASVTIGLLLAVPTLTLAEEPGAEPEPPQVKADINADGVAAIIRARVSVSVLDARGSMPERLPGAKPLAPNASATTVARLLPSKTQLIITYCADANCPKSKQLADRLLRDGYANVIRFTGGVEAWTKARYRLSKVVPPTQQPPANTPPRGSGTRRGSGSRR